MKITCLIETANKKEIARLDTLGINSVSIGDGKVGYYFPIELLEQIKRFEPVVNEYVEIRDSPLHGKGGYAKRDIKKGTRIIEYTGRHMSWDEALENMPHDPKEPFHTFILESENQVIDAFYGGNDAKWLNHSCDPNCYSEEDEDKHMYLYAKRNIKKGEELFWDYGLTMEGERMTKQLRDNYACRCGSKNCRGTMLAYTPPKKRGAK